MGIVNRKNPDVLDGAVARQQSIDEATADASGPGGTEAGSRTLAERLQAKANVQKRTGRE
jgi:hypothetical protein